MAQPLSADALVRALRAEGLAVVEHRSWRTHSRAGHGAWGPVNGVMIHHTVTSGTTDSVNLCYDGHSTLPGPLCHGVIAKDGTVYLVGHGRANHAGSGDGDVLAAVVAERALPAPNQANTDGNARFYGFECVNLGDGNDPWPATQLLAIERAAAALCRAHGWDQRSVIGHKEWQPGKVDPRGFTMPSMRDRIAARLARPAGTTTTTPTTTSPEEDDPMGMTPDQIYDAVWRRDRMTPPTGAETKANPTWAAESVLRDAANQARGVRAALAAQAATITELARAVADRNTDINADALIARITTAIEGITVRLDTTPEA